jgi:diguanylate cyclase (GGDEF)-like protein
VFGWSTQALKGHPEDEFVHPDDRPTLATDRAVLALSQSVTTCDRVLCGDGSYRWVESMSWRADSHVGGDGRIGTKGSGMAVVMHLRDISERQARTKTLERQAFTDPLTGVANRTVLMDRLQQGLLRLSRGGMLAVLYLDIDRFKVINDSLGHRIGDAILLQLAGRLAHHLRPADTLARLGGDEFVVVAELLTDEQGVDDLVQRIVDVGREPFRVDGDDFICTLSVGAAHTRDSQRAPQDLLAEADLALYRAKEGGRDRAEIFDERLRTEAVGRLVTERLLRVALEKRTVVVEYQPIIDLRTLQPVTAEALIRIREPGGGLLQPDAFLEVAEETGLLIGMDDQVLVDAVQQAGEWHDHLADTAFAGVSINVTARHLADAGFERALLNELDRRDVAHHDLQVEVTERVLIEASNSALTSLRALRASGVRVGLDDFGTGYSSVSYLRQFPIDFVKIDQSCIHELDRGDREVAIVGAEIDLCHALGLTVVAEGVETEQQLQVLKSLECDFAQGFLFAKSGPPSAVERLVRLAATGSATMLWLPSAT